MKPIIFFKTILIAILFGGVLTMVSCKDELPGAMDTSDKFTVLKSIKIVNAGPNGNEVVIGTVNEDTKTVTFPRLDTLTDFSKLRFEAELSEGATLDQETYTVPFSEGESERTIVIKVVNSPRYREYYVRIRLKVPVYGADFKKGTIYDFTNNPIGNPIYPAHTFTAMTRGSAFDGEHVLVVSRSTMGTHLLKVSDLKNYDTTPIPLNMTGVSMGTFPVNMGALVNGHIYVANLSGNTAASPMRVYHWTNPAEPPQMIVDLNVGTVANAGVRHGDHFSVSLDDSGNGYMFFGDNAGTKVLRLKVENYTTVSDPFVFNMPVSGAGSWTTYNRIGNSSEYIFTGHDAPVTLVTESGSVIFQMSRTAIPIRSSDARVIYFNGERYLIVTTAARTGSEATNFAVYDITKGASVSEALATLNSTPNVKPVFEHSLMGPVNTSPSSNTGWAIKKDSQGNDESLLLFSAASDAGFVFFEFPKKVLEDE